MQESSIMDLQPILYINSIYAHSYYFYSNGNIYVVLWDYIFNEYISGYQIPLKLLSNIHIKIADAYDIDLSTQVTKDIIAVFKHFPMFTDLVPECRKCIINFLRLKKCYKLCRSLNQ